MSYSLNKVILIGNVGRDPEFSVMPSGDRMVRISLATSRQWKDRSGNKVEKTAWHRIVTDEKRFEHFLPYVKKGRSILVEGEIEYRQFTGEDGQVRYVTEIRPVTMQFFGGSGNGNAAGNAGQASHNDSTGSSEPPPDFDSQGGAAANMARGDHVAAQQTTAAAARAPARTEAAGRTDEFTDFDSDIPF